MLRSPYWQLDVFAERPGQGNPLGVVLDARDWSDAAMQAFARWAALVETTFLLPPTQPGAGYRVRIFTPQREIAFAGHPSLGSAHAALDSGRAALQADTVVQECAAGQLPIRAEAAAGQRWLYVQAPRARVLRTDTAAPADAALVHLLPPPTRGALPPALVEGGRRWWIAELADEAAVRAYSPDTAAIAALAAGVGAELVQVIGRNGLLFKRNPEKPKIEFPAGGAAVSAKPAKPAPAQAEAAKAAPGAKPARKAVAGPRSVTTPGPGTAGGQKTRGRLRPPGGEAAGYKPRGVAKPRAESYTDGRGKHAYQGKPGLGQADRRQSGHKYADPQHRQTKLAANRKLVRELSDLANQGKQIILVTSGAVGAGMDRRTAKASTPSDSPAGRTRRGIRS